MMHPAFTLSVRGIPQLCYGEEIAMEGKEDPRQSPGFFPAGSLVIRAVLLPRKA